MAWFWLISTYLLHGSRLFWFILHQIGQAKSSKKFIPFQRFYIKSNILISVKFTNIVEFILACNYFADFL